jgi:hypothetical protein
MTALCQSGAIRGGGANIPTSELRCQGVILEFNPVNEKGPLKLIQGRDAL